MALLLRPAVALAGITFGLLALAIARRDPGYSLAGASAARAAAELGAGWTLLAVGLTSWRLRPGSRFGLLLVAASFGWFLAEWNNPGIGSALGFAIGLSLYAVAPPLVAHAALSYPGGLLSSWLDRIGLALAYAAALALGPLAAFFFEPARTCGECPRNLLLAHDSPRLFDRLNWIGIHAGLVSSLALITLLAFRFVRSTPALRRLIWPVLGAAGAYLGFVAWDFAHSVARGTLGNDVTDGNLWLGEAGSLVLLSLAVVWGWLRRRRTRGAVARLVVALAEAPPPGGLRDVLSRTLADPSLLLAYSLSDGRIADAHGRPLALVGEVTPLVRGGQEVALLAHRPGLLDDPGLVEEVAAAARLALENERLQAEARVQLEDLRASRVRAIDSGDAERRRLERDLHDGAQQQLVGLSLTLRLVRSGLGSDPEPELLARIDEAEAELRNTLAELRDLARGLFPVVLAEEGLAAAVEALAEIASVPIHITRLPRERFDPSIEAAAYFVIAEALARSAIGIAIGAASDHARLVIDMEVDRPPEHLDELEDRLGALDGTIEVTREPGAPVRVHVEIPCES